MNESKKLFLRFIAIGALVSLVIGLFLNIFFGIIAFWIAISIYFVVAIITVVKAWTQVPQRWVYVVERFGKYYMMLEPGLHFVFPWLSFYEVKHKIFTGTMKMALFDDEVEDSDDYQGGIVDFKDESAKIKAFIFFHVTRFELSDADKEGKTVQEIKDLTEEGQKEVYKQAAYETSDPIAYIKAAAEAALRSFLAQYNLFDANELKSTFDLVEVANMMGPDEVKLRKRNNDTGGKWENTRFGEKMTKWGFTPTSFIITEFQFPDRVIEQRARLMKAQKDEKIAQHRKNENIILSKGEAEALRNLSEARAEEVDKMMKKTGASKEEAFLFIVNRQKYEALAKAGEVRWLGGADNDDVKRGAAFGLGFEK